MEICLFEPEIPQNTATLARFGACLGIPLNIIEPASFVMSDKAFKRAGMDYLDVATIKKHNDFSAFRQNYAGRIILLDTKGIIPYTEYLYKSTDCIMAGRESCGVPGEIFDACDERVVIPMLPGRRS